MLPSGADDGQPEPRVVGTVAGGDHHGADALARRGRANAGRRRYVERTRPVRRQHLGAESGHGDVLVDVVEEVGASPGRRRRPCSARSPGTAPGFPASRRSGPTSRTPRCLQRRAGRGRVGAAWPPGRPTSWSDGSRRAATGSGTSSIVRASRPVLSQPPEDVHAPVATWHPGVPSDGEDDVASGPAELVGDLHARRRRADHEHASRRQQGWVAVGGWTVEHVAPCRGQRARRGVPCGPVATTTWRARQVPRSVTTRYCPEAADAAARAPSVPPTTGAPNDSA